MERISRAAAVAAGQSTFFTGEPCKRGHVTYRYVKNGGCSDCIKTAANMTAPPSQDDTTRKLEREKLVQVKLRAFPGDLPSLKSAALAFAAMRCPQLREVDVYPNLLPTNQAGGTGLYRFNCYQEDLDALRGVANSLLGAHAVDTSHVRAAAIAQAPTGQEPPEWRFT